MMCFSIYILLFFIVFFTAARAIKNDEKCGKQENDANCSKARKAITNEVVLIM